MLAPNAHTVPSDLRIKVKKLPAEIAGVVLKLATEPDDPPDGLPLEEVLLDEVLPDDEPLVLLAAGSLPPPPPPQADRTSVVSRQKVVLNGFFMDVESRFIDLTLT